MHWMNKRAIWIQSTVLFFVLGADRFTGPHSDSGRRRASSGDSGAAALPRLDKLDPLLQSALFNPPPRSRIIVRATSSQTLASLAPLIQQLGGVLGRQLPIIDAQVADMPTASLLALSASNAVQRISLDRTAVGTLERTSAAVGATRRARCSVMTGPASPSRWSIPA